MSLNLQCLANDGTMSRGDLQGGDFISSNVGMGEGCREDFEGCWTAPV